MSSPRGVGFWACVLGVAAVQVAAFHDVRGDDAYITYRYGQNLASGLGLVFSAGERIQGFTSPGHALLAAAVYALVGREATPGVMSGLGCLAWTAEVVALYGLLLPCGRAIAALSALLIALGAAAGAGWVMLETHFVMACVLGGLAAAVHQRWYLAAASCALGVLFRPDAALAAALVMGSCIWQLRSAALRPLALFLAIALPWPLFASLYYGSPLPQTAVTKFQRTEFLEYLTHEVTFPTQRLLWESAARPFGGVALLVAALGAGRAWRGGVWLLPAWGWLHAAAYLVLRPFTGHGWHLYPWSLAICACVCIGLAPWGSAGPRAVAALRAGLCAALLALALYRFADDARHLADGYWTGQRDAVYRRVAAQLRSEARPGDEFAAVEVGTIAYYSDLPAFDLGGLVTPPEQSLAGRSVRFLVLDTAYDHLKPASAQERQVVREGDFEARVYELGE